jgi:hypothetical protein
MSPGSQGGGGPPVVDVSAPPLELPTAPVVPPPVVPDVLPGTTPEVVEGSPVVAVVPVASVPVTVASVPVTVGSVLVVGLVVVVMPCVFEPPLVVAVPVAVSLEPVVVGELALVVPPVDPGPPVALASLPPVASPHPATSHTNVPTHRTFCIRPSYAGPRAGVSVPGPIATKSGNH